MLNVVSIHYICIYDPISWIIVQTRRRNGTVRDTCIIIAAFQRFAHISTASIPARKLHTLSSTVITSIFKFPHDD